MQTECTLTTFDNPFDPFEQFDSWFMFDVGKGYNTCSHIARVIDTLCDYYSNDLTQQEEDEINEEAIDRIISLDFMHIYKKVYRNSEKNKEESTATT